MSVLIAGIPNNLPDIFEICSMVVSPCWKATPESNWFCAVLQTATDTDQTASFIKVRLV